MNIIRLYFIPSRLTIAIIRFAFFFAVFISLPIILLAANGQPAAQSLLQQLLPFLITALVPGIIAIVKLLLPKIPGWLLPILAPVIGILLGYIQTIIPGADADPIKAAIMGGLGVCLREIYDQIKKAIPSNV